MGKVAGAQNFDGANWYEQHIAKRTRDALAEQDRAFAEKHAGDSLDQLAALSASFQSPKRSAM